MKIIALCSVDESVLRSTLDLGEKDTIDADTVTSEFGWLNDSGIVLNECHETKKVEEVTEYWGFIWNLKREKYVPITIPCSNVGCKKRDICSFCKQPDRVRYQIRRIQ